MERRKFTREFKLEAVRLIKDRGGVVCAGVARPEGASDAAAQLGDPRGAFPGQGQMKPEQLEIARLKREVTKLKAERDILKKAAAYTAQSRIRIRMFITRHMSTTTLQMTRPTNLTHILTGIHGRNTHIRIYPICTTSTGIPDLL